MSSATLAATVAIAVVVLCCRDSSASPDMLEKSLPRSSRMLASPSTGRYPFSRLIANRGALLAGDTGRSSLLSTDLGRPKRALFDDSCKGVYDRELFAKLDRVCEDCYNLYRKPSVSYECREDCFQSSVYRQCVTALLLPLHRYILYAHSLYTKRTKKFAFLPHYRHSRVRQGLNPQLYVRSLATKNNSPAFSSDRNANRGSAGPKLRVVNFKDKFISDYETSTTRNFTRQGVTKNNTVTQNHAQRLGNSIPQSSQTNI